MRLDVQRIPARYHVRPNSRRYLRGYDTTPHVVWGDVDAEPVEQPAPVVPRILNIEPDHITAGIGTPVELTITGSGFEPTSRGQVGATTIPSIFLAVVYVSANTLRVMLAPFLLAVPNFLHLRIINTSGLQSDNEDIHVEAP